MGSTSSKIRLFITIIFNAAMWFLFSGEGRKWERITLVYKAGGMLLVWQFAVIKFGSKYEEYKPLQNQISQSQSKKLIAGFNSKPLISIVVPVYKIAPKWLDKCIQSVFLQHYTSWHLILVDDNSQSPALSELMKTWAVKDRRIEVVALAENQGIAGATNAGLEHVQGQYVAFLDHDDELSPDALTWVVHAINKNQGAMWFYSDEDKISANGKYHGPHLKPDFSPELLLSQMFTCHFSVYAASVIKQVKGLRSDFDGSQDHDLALRISEIVPQRRVIHIPRVLYHWRQIPGSTALCLNSKPKAPISGVNAVSEALQRRGIKADVVSNSVCPTVYEIYFQSIQQPSVSIIIPTRNAFELLKKAVVSIRTKTNYRHYEIIIIDHNSDDKNLLAYLENEQNNRKLKVLKYQKPFNHSDMNNFAVASVNSEFVVFMNNDVEITSENWLEQLVAVTELDKSIAAVGGLLLYPNGNVQHGGIILGISGLAGHAHKNLPAKLPGYFGRLHSLQEMSGVTAALVLIRRSSFLSIGGFNSGRYPTLYNDVDLCIRLKKAGFRCIYNPTVQAVHHEIKTRPLTYEQFLRNRKILAQDYAEILRNDPFYNPNLTLDNEQFNGYRDFPVENQIQKLTNIPEGYHA